MTHELLIEIGVEELPASFLAQGLASLQAAVERLLGEARLTYERTRPLGTPRRLALVVYGLAEHQSNLDEVVTGPPYAAAFDPDGKPKRAAEGFAKKQGVEVSALTVVDTDKGRYVAAHRREAGAPAADVLPRLLGEAVANVRFPKSMRWAEGDLAFGRPIHWLLALLDDAVVPFTFGGLVASRHTRGHRFLAPAPFELRSAGAYVDALGAAHVVVDPAARRERMREALVAAAARLGGVLAPDAFLLDECAALVEEPFVVPGAFDEAFLGLPDGVVVSVMRDHQRYFAVRARDGGPLLPAYLNVVNTARAPETIARGNDRVLRARLADARFFVDEDKERLLESRLDKLDKVVFQSKLGTVGAKIRRIERLSGWVARRSAAEAAVDEGRARLAARLCKCDLETLVVFEFPELQGEMGRWYALAEGVDPEVADAIREHYQPQGVDDAPPRGVLGAVVSVADRADTLVGCFGIGLTPTGSADPFALRRAALGLIRVALEGPIDVDLRGVFGEAYDGYEGVALDERAGVLDALDAFVRGRLRALLRSDFPVDVIEACLGAWDGGSVRDLRARLDAVAAFRAEPAFESLAVAFKRAYNITQDAVRGEVDQALLEDGAERVLAERFADVRPSLAEAEAERRYADALGIVARELREPIDRFFDDVFVMVDDARVRDNRLRLLAGIADAVNRIAHVHQLGG
ncbi:MAG: glycine--tRNA ligase subunit beta [Myxococcales bacterium]|nr:glycine--tRNA ligase subunit beta [Myxococcales bacterium]